MSAIAAYRALLRIVGPAYILVAFLGRIPLAMSQLGRPGPGQLRAGQLRGRRRGGRCAGGRPTRSGRRSPERSRTASGSVPSCWSSRSSVRWVWPPSSWSPTPDAPRALIFAAAAVTGFAMPQVGPLARVRWRPITRDTGDQRRLVDAAFSYEGAADEASFVLGPALIGVLGDRGRAGRCIARGGGAARGVRLVVRDAPDLRAGRPARRGRRAGSAVSRCGPGSSSCWSWPSCASG